MQLNQIIRRVSITVLSCFVLAAPRLWAADCLVYFGTFTDTTSKGVYVSRLDMDTGKLSAPELAVAVPSPNYLAVSPDGRSLYVSERRDNSTNGGSIDAFAIDNHTGSLKLLDKKSAGGAGPCFVGIDAAGQNVFCANYNGGSVKSFHVNVDGTLTDGTFVQHYGHSINPDRQPGPHAHCFVGAPSGPFALACDLGLDKVMVYHVDPATAALTPGDPPFATVAPGSGPRHVAFSPDGKTACVICEMGGTVNVFDWDGSTGTLHHRQTVSLLLPGLYQNTFTSAEIVYSPDGKFVYATIRGPAGMRGANSISTLSVDQKTGDLTLIQNIPCDGDFPRGLGVDPSGRWLIVGNQKSGTVTEFAIGPDGRIRPVGKPFAVGSAVDVKFAPVQ
jgi:6-phosphogluconolactonase